MFRLHSSHRKMFCMVVQGEIRVQGNTDTRVKIVTSPKQFSSITAENEDDGADTSKGECNEAFLSIFTTYPKYLPLFTTRLE